jgi:Mg-chelatase subunit ChlD
MKTTAKSLFILWGILPALAAATAPRAAAEEGVALAIVYDTSGSMSEPVKDSSGKMSPKYRIANRALEAIAKQIQAYAGKPGEAAQRKVHAGLFTFDGSGTRAVVPFGPFDAQAMIDWARRFSTPGSGTPLGNAVRAASDTVLKSSLARKHVLVITDGMNTIGPDPATVLPSLKRQAEAKQTTLGLHFVAFDVDASVFNSVKKQGATVLGAADEKQLNKQLGAIMQEKILLEDEEPARKK